MCGPETRWFAIDVTVGVVLFKGHDAGLEAFERHAWGRTQRAQAGSSLLLVVFLAQALLGAHVLDAKV
jgi:hypothetical protein